MKQLVLATLCLAALVSACGGGSDSGSSADTTAAPTTTEDQSLTLALTLGTSDGHIAGYDRYSNAPARSNEPSDHYCIWGETPRWEVADGAGTVVATGAFEVREETDGGGDPFSLGDLVSLGPGIDYRCELTTNAQLDAVPDVVTITVSGRSWDLIGGVNDGDDWSVSSTLADDELQGGALEFDVVEADIT